LAFILALGVPLSVVGGLLARHAAGFRPAPVAALIGLSAASFASIGLTLVHHLDAAMAVLVWHGLAVVAVTLGATLFGPRAMAAAG
ncbi:MAG: NrsF family protein, partial [Acetobacteraceae bacterium]